MRFTTRLFHCAHCIESYSGGIWRSLQITIFNTNQGASTIMHRAFDLKRSMNSMLQVEAIPQSCVP
jgi:hypothetical protein